MQNTLPLTDFDLMQFKPVTMVKLLWSVESQGNAVDYSVLSQRWDAAIFSFSLNNWFVLLCTLYCKSSEKRS